MSKTRKLSINRQTLRDLNPSTLRSAAGGGTIPGNIIKSVLGGQTCWGASCVPTCANP